MAPLAWVKSVSAHMHEMQRSGRRVSSVGAAIGHPETGHIPSSRCSTYIWDPAGGVNISCAIVGLDRPMQVPARLCT
eukprot:COSAG01_NODE_2137_length_8329_cov_52.487242_14_plen_77_part_00